MPGHLDELILTLRRPLLADSLSQVLTQRFAEAGVSVAVSRSPGESLDRSKGKRSSRRAGVRVLLTDRTDAISLRLIEQALPVDAVVSLGQPGHPIGGKVLVLSPHTDVDTIFTRLFPLFPAPKAVAKAKPVGKRLSLRETEVLRQLALGRSMHEIADDLSLAKRTVENLKYRITEKVGMKTLPELTRYAIRIRLVDL